MTMGQFSASSDIPCSTRVSVSDFEEILHTRVTDMLTTVSKSNVYSNTDIDIPYVDMIPRKLSNGSVSAVFSENCTGIATTNRLTQV